MRYSFLTLLCFLFFTQQKLLSQPLPDTLIINFLDWNAVPKYDQVKHKQNITFKIINLNKNLFKVEGTFTQSSYNQKPPDIFFGLKLPGYLNLRLPPVNEAADTKINTAAAPADGIVNYKQTINELLDIINNAYNKFEELPILNNHLVNYAATCDKSYATINGELITLVNSYTGQNASQRGVQSGQLLSFIEQFITDAIHASDSISKIAPKLLNGIEKTTYANTGIIDDWNKKPLPAKDPGFQKGQLAVNRATEENKELKKYQDSVTAVIQKAKELIDLMKNFRKENKIQAVVNNYNLINEANFTYISDPVKITEDELKTELKISSEKLLPCTIPQTLTFKQTYKTFGGWKIDFSSGLFFNGGNADFLGRELMYKPVNDSVVTIENKNGGKRLLLSVGSLMHIYYRRSGKTFWAISPGLSTTTAFDGLQFHLGGSVIFGTKNRLVITAGSTFREAKILDKNYSYAKQYLKKALPENPPTIKAFPKFGFFLSLTYNWSKLTKQ